MDRFRFPHLLSPRLCVFALVNDVLVVCRYNNKIKINIAVRFIDIRVLFKFLAAAFNRPPGPGRESTVHIV